ncbi:hypothetical protein LOZ07_004750 [Ophidiomyces ophidiicola]|nr:hypothetical protein LOZ48_003945 [Ophidiomyces ophidiicola]KAI2292222.1 hypothetical protein LOZ07_004750 [Ophidiomyces ophidiicola]KAI2302343.1 hypothetical protein LOZ06_004406 [Ophidiomyces ophidiicola]KAI2355663.1 hypothetical protein LOY92_000978 [Ophidiomyces ophidiicola]KAI2403996.1 hypothetical protein LOY90_004662 [Ophidiomyces ophidiicola]
MMNPDYKESSENSITALRDLARKHLEKAGIRVLYGFYSEPTEKTKSWITIRDSLNANEAVAISGTADAVAKFYKGVGKSIPAKQRMSDHGLFNTFFKQSVFDELKKLSDARDRGELGRTFGWTVAAHKTGTAALMLKTSRVDGIIYGNGLRHYTDHTTTKSAFSTISTFIKENPSTHHLAKANEYPW